MQDIRLCFLGDSFVNGTAEIAHLGWAGRLCQPLSEHGVEVTYYNLGIRRETTTGLAVRWQAEARRRLAQGTDNRLIFSFGTNDTTIEGGKQRVETAVSIQNAHHILMTAQQHYPVLMISPPPIADDAQNGRTQTLAAHFATLCQELAIPYLDVFTPLLHSSTWRDEIIAGDGAHPNANGYAELANLVKDWSFWRNWFE